MGFDEIILAMDFRPWALASFCVNMGFFEL